MRSTAEFGTACFVQLPAAGAIAKIAAPAQKVSLTENGGEAAFRSR